MAIRILPDFPPSLKSFALSPPSLPVYPLDVATTIILLAVFGILALIAEMVLPGGILGVAGGLCLLAAAIMSYVEWGFVVGSVVSVGLFVISLLIFQLWMKYFHLLPGTRKLVLQGSIDQGDAQPCQEAIEGRKGAALTDIAPSGKALIDDQRFDVVSE